MRIDKYYVVLDGPTSSDLKRSYVAYAYVFFFYMYICTAICTASGIGKWDEYRGLSLDFIASHVLSVFVNSSMLTVILCIFTSVLFDIPLGGSVILVAIQLSLVGLVGTGFGILLSSFIGDSLLNILLAIDAFGLHLLIEEGKYGATEFPVSVHSDSRQAQLKIGDFRIDLSGETVRQRSQKKSTMRLASRSPTWRI